jgi:hypothetical protein
VVWDEASGAFAISVSQTVGARKLCRDDLVAEGAALEAVALLGTRADPFQTSSTDIMPESARFLKNALSYSRYSQASHIPPNAARTIPGPEMRRD